MEKSLKAIKAHAFLLEISKKMQHDNFHKFMQTADIISIESRVDKSLSLTFFLVKTIIGQQVSVKAAESIWLKVQNVLNNSLSNISLELLREQGLSKPKASYVHGIILDKKIQLLDKASLKKLSDEDLSNLFLSIKGVGPWTLGVIRMFYIQDSNVFLKGDLAINKALGNFFNSIKYDGEDYSPYKTYLCLYLWRSLKS
ncbi:DNA-3-methyladenine glycosylase 2 family protein [Gammaproteobacteria bacterium]|jgi:DNA-3-methyladenine glycosylase II|nr:DNA-3-methyladenine glycosylase 2 family protein [Gammaproteobacteria bacterium]MDA7844275.1 DNA-3-methyladenine glycosylase 2 family protein [Gammaproteobacteria bacterium]MDA9101808.1 DNA-3-methyladenine glycosylase 2 family protein [Gammaproteobacteria bacterium]